MSKKIPIHLNDKDLKNIKELAGYLKLADTYGEIPKTIKFSIAFTLEQLKRLEKSIPHLDPSETDTLLASLKWIRTQRIKLETARKLEKEAEKYSS